MSPSAPIRIPFLVLVTIVCLAGPASAASLIVDWKQSPILAENVFSGVTITPDGSTIYSGGSQLLVRSWDGESHWGGHPGFIAAMSADGNYVVTSTGSTITLLNKTGTQLWSRNMEGQIRAVAVAPDAAFVISADDKGNYNSWAANGEFNGRNKTDMVKRIAISPSGDLVVVTTEAGIRYYDSALEPLWTDSRAGNLDNYILISEDGSAIITAGGSRVSSHTRKGALNWQIDVSDAAINDIAASRDCSIIVVGSQDNKVRAIDRYGKIHWTYPIGQWANAVGISGNGGVVAVGSNDGTVYVLDNGGTLQTKRSFDSRIQLRTLAVSSNGARIVAADQFYLYGMTLSGAPAVKATDSGPDTIYITATRTPVPATTLTTVTNTATQPPVEVTMPEEARPTAATTTKQSPVSPWILVPATAGALILAARQGRHS